LWNWIPLQRLIFYHCKINCGLTSQIVINEHVMRDFCFCCDKQKWRRETQWWVYDSK